MLNESQFLLSLDGLKTILIHDLTILDVALAYVLVYVVYKALGRYVYFKPQEHASKINRTFLALSLVTVSLHYLNGVINVLPFLPEHRWVYAISGLVLLIAPLSILMHWLIWKYDRGYRWPRYDDYLPIQPDYYKRPIDKEERISENSTRHYEEEGVRSTDQNLHSDALLNVLALIVFVCVGWTWASESAATYGPYAFRFFGAIALWISAVYLDSSVISWIDYLEKKWWPLQEKWRQKWKAWKSS